MAFQALNGGFFWPDTMGGGNDGYSRFTTNALNINASGEKVAFVFQAPKTGNIDRVFAYISAKSVNGTLDVRLETVSTSTGQPTGTLVATNTSGTYSYTAAPDVIDVTLTAVCPVVKGTFYAIVIKQNAGDCDIQSVNNYVNNLKGGLYSRFTTTYHDNGAGYSARNSVTSVKTRPCFAARYDDTNYYYIPGNICASTFAQTLFNNTSTTRERGLCFTLPFPVRVTGFYLHGSLPNGDYSVILADSGGSALLTHTGDKDIGSYYFNGSAYGDCYMGYFDSTTDLAAATKYYLTLRPDSASDIVLDEMTLISGSGIAAQMGMWNGGTAGYLVTRASGGAYTETTTQRPYGMGLIVSAFDDGAGGGGGAAPMFFITE